MTEEETALAQLLWEEARAHGEPWSAMQSDAVASCLIQHGYRRHPAGITDEAVHAAAVAIDPSAWEPGPFYHSMMSSAGRDLSLVQARAALEAAETVRHANE